MKTDAKAPKRRSKLSEKAVRDALCRTGGNAAAAARALNVSRSSVYYYIQSRPEIRQLVNEFQEALADYAETGLFNAVLNGEPWAIMFALTHTTAGRARGYGRPLPAKEPEPVAPRSGHDESADVFVSAVEGFLDRVKLEALS